MYIVKNGSLQHFNKKNLAIRSWDENCHVCVGSSGDLEAQVGLIFHHVPELNVLNESTKS